ncbi:hypothetical protein [Streptomyces sp. NPDC014685]|uniref:hypothetical protein n=1 Tax=Streptomyces sp. NPDC014685 TaxID=3364881 RepID=UPI0036F765FC
MRRRTRQPTDERSGRHRGLDAPAPEVIRTAWALGSALASEYERAGTPLLSGLVRLDGDRATHSARPTAWRIIRRYGLPANAEQLQTFVDVCRVRRSAQRHYREASGHIRAARCNRPTPPQHTARPAPGPARGHGTGKITP